MRRGTHAATAPPGGLAPLGVGVPEGARSIGVSISTLYEYLRRGEIKAAKIGSRTVIPVAELERFLAARTGAPLLHRGRGYRPV